MTEEEVLMIIKPEQLQEENQQRALLETEYLDEAGMRCCRICGKRKENEYELMGRKYRFRCLCSCEQEAVELEKEAARKQDAEIQISQLKSVGLTESKFREWTFENDRSNNPKMELGKAYVKNWQQIKELNQGYLICGPVGTGKSFFAGCIANALMDQGIPVMMTNFSKILNELNNRFEGRNELIGHLVSYPLLIIDDLGIERDSPYALEMIFNIIDRRYCIKKPLIVTTNLTLRELTSPTLDISHQRIYSRLLEMCMPVIFDGEDMRHLIKSEKRNKFKEIIGIE